ncbi:MAG: hypothetical protein DLD55_02605 [candidate division SR1 bacterium]|nr:MAG: hypothetical protein DLD55_02605 [candidate division SR1 bacterium]
MKKQLYLDFIKTLLPDGEFEAFKASYQQRIPKSIKLISQKAKKSDLLAYFSSQSRTLTPPDLSHDQTFYDDVLYVSKEEKSSLGSHFLHQGGFFYVQEVAAGLSAQILNPQAGDLVLDLCAAPGGKSLQLADVLLSQGAGFVLANEPLSPRRKALIFNLNRCGLHNTGILAYRGEQVGDFVPESFDKVLVDAPCSGEGMNYKHDKNTRYRDAKTAQQFAQLQLQILISGLKALKVGGELVYSTCTLNPLENEGVISQILKLFPEQIELLPVPIDQKSPGLTDYLGQELLSEQQACKLARFWPHIQHTGGFFIAKLRKLAPLPYTPQRDQRKQEQSGLQVSSQLQDQVRTFLNEQWGMQRDEKLTFVASDSAIYLTSSERKKLPSQLFIEKIGIPLFKIGFKGEWIPQQGLATCLGDNAVLNTYEITDEQAQKLSDKLDLQEKRGADGQFLILQRKGHGFALVKQVGEILKNKMG